MEHKWLGEPLRLDAAIPTLMDGISRSMAQKLIENGDITVCAKTVKTNYKVKYGDIIEITVPEPEEYNAVPEDIPIDIIYEDKDLALINKSRGMVVHPAPGHSTGTLVNAIMYHIKDLSGIGGVLRPGIVHRLDKDTSGLILIAKNDAAHESLSRQLEDKTMNRRYLAVCKGNFKEDAFEVEENIDRSKSDRKKMAVCLKDQGRYAKTAFRVVDKVEGYTLVECRLFTGRTHQIRVHLSHIGHSIVGDEVYGKKGKVNFDGQALHAYRLEFVHPSTGKIMAFIASPPGEFMDLLSKLKLNINDLNICVEEI